MPSELVDRMVSHRAASPARVHPTMIVGGAPAPPLEEPHGLDDSRDDGVRLRDTEPHPERELPANIAVLVVLRTMGGPDDLRLIGRSRAAPIPRRKQLGAHREPKISLARIARTGGKSPDTVLYYADAWSRGAGSAFVDWIAKLHAQKGDELELLIEDTTGFEIPWELLTLPGAHDAGRRSYVGAVVPVTRWQMRTLAEEGDAIYSHDTVESAGRVAAYLNDELGQIEAEVHSLDGLGAERFWDVERFAEFLERDDDGYALVYMACHGVMARELDAVALGSRHSATQQLTFARLDYAALRLLRRTGSVVFLNACHSGRFFEDDALADDRLYGFPDLFLRHGATGVIATSGEVSDRFAVEMARALIHAAAGAGDVPVAVLLQRERGALAARYARGEVNAAALVSAFMYLYHGNPRCTLRIAPQR